MADEKIIIEVEANAVAVAKLREEIRKLRETRKLLAKDTAANATELKKLDTEIAIGNEKLKVQNTSLRQSSKEFISQAGSIEQLRNTTTRLTKSREQLNQGTKKGQAEFKKLTAQIKKNETQLKKWDTQIGKSQRNVGNYSSAFTGLAGAMGVTLGAAGIFQVLKSANTVIKDFGKQSAVLAGVLKLEVDEITELTTQAKELAAVYPTLASEVLTLQESYARLGFTQAEILALTESTIKGSFALNAELGDTANLTGAVVRAMDNLDATDSPAIMDKLSRSTQISSLNFEKLSTALPKVAGAANAMGISLDTVLSQLAVAQDATQDASIAGTSLRNIYLELSKKGITLDQALNKINDSTDKVTTANELFGKRATITALALANQTEKTRENEQAIKDSAGTADSVAKTQMNTYAAAVDKVASAWEGFVLSFQTAEGPLKKSLKIIADALNYITFGEAAIQYEVAKESLSDFMLTIREENKETIPSLIDFSKQLDSTIKQFDEEIKAQRYNNDKTKEYIQIRDQQIKVLELVRKEIENLSQAEEDARQKEIKINEERIARELRQSEELKAIQNQRANNIIDGIEAIEVKQIESNEIEAKQVDFSNRLQQNKTDFELQQSQERIRQSYLEAQTKRDNLKMGADLLGQSAALFKKNTIAFKVLASGQAIISTYLAATKALAEVPFPFNIAAAGITIAAGLKSVAEINGAKFEQGTILSGPSHSGGGIQLFGSSGYYGEAEGGEPILTKGVSQNPYLLRAASDINVAGGGRPLFASGGIAGSTQQNILQGGQTTTKTVYQPVLVVDDVTELQNINNAIQLLAID